MIYRVGGRTAATAATANNAAAALWNPSTTVPLWVRELHVASTSAGVSNLAIERISARGTSTLTTTPDVDNDVEKALAPPSGALLDLTYSAQPTFLTPEMERWNLPAVAGAGVMWVFGEKNRGAIKVPPGNGLCLYTPVAVILPVSDVTFVWEE